MNFKAWKIIAAKKARKERRKSNASFQAKIAGKEVKPSKKALRKAIWNLVSRIVRRRDSKINDGKCLICNVRPIQCAYHIEPSQAGDSIRYDFDAIIGACHGCNFGESLWRKKYRAKHIKIFGEERVLALEKKAQEVVRLSFADLAELQAKLQSVWAEMNP